MSRKTNKTNHVLNLLAAGVKASSETADSAAAEASSTEASAAETSPKEPVAKAASAASAASPAAGASAASAGAPAAGQSSNVSVVRRGDDGVAEQIRETLEKELETSLEQEKAIQEKAAQQKAEQQKAAQQKQKETADRAKDVPEKESRDPDAAPPAKPGTVSSEPAQKSASAAPEEEDDFFIVNVMERLVKEKAPQYISQFHVCGCRRCLADVTALALTELPAKYVVINRSAVSPLMNFYTTKYSGRITVEVTKACMAVQKNPHHDK